MRVMITVKAYPTPSSKYTETVCVAGVRLDTTPNQWVRLYPVPFRMLPESRRFKKYDIVELRAIPARDGRPESYKPILESIRTVDHVACGPYWAERLPILKPLEVASMCELKRMQAKDGTSLGFFKPAKVTDFRVVPTSTDWGDGQHAALGQSNLFCELRTTLEKIPYEFRYEYKCYEATCPGHDMKIIDWETAQLYRHTRGRSENERRRLMREKWLDQICGPRRDTCFYAGNIASHQRSFLLLGAVWPRKQKARVTRLQRATLFELGQVADL
jgi:hypothetical protein